MGEEMSASEVLVKARALIEEPHRWTRHTDARDRLGKPVSPLANSATCFCAVGAIERAGGPWTITTPAVEALRRVTYIAPVIWNDSHSHAEVLAAFDKAIAECGS